MSLHDDRRGQIYTIEGVVASFILLSVLLFILQSNSIIVPQTERSIDMKLYEQASDTLINLDRSDNDSWSPILPLKTYVANWNGTTGTLTPQLEQNITAMLLGQNVTAMTPGQVQYNLEFTYNNSTAMNHSVVISHGVPTDNSVTATRIITLNDQDIAGGSTFWKTINATRKQPEVVEVKIICWYL